MRRFLSTTVAACAALLLLAPTTASAEPAARLKIAHNTSAIWQFDGTILGTGPTFDAVTVYAQVRNCPVGSYLFHMTLVQDGVSYPVASDSRGSSELNCTATDPAPRVLEGFYGNGLHPGPALATVDFSYRQADGTYVLVQSSRTVRIPAGPNQP
jgi:hypothetical protein